MSKKILCLFLGFWLGIFSFCSRPEKKPAPQTSQKKNITEQRALKTFGPSVAGSFYPAQPEQLKSMIDKFLSQAQIPQLKGELLGVLAPHAGYIYSGPVAGYAFKAIQQSRKNKFVIIGPSHYYPGAGKVAVLEADYYQTPLGKVKINRSKVKELLSQGDWLIGSAQYFYPEHSVEVEIPFLQVAVGKELEIVLIVMPDPSLKMAEKLASALLKIFPSSEWGFVASSDLSHYHPHEQAKSLDQHTLKFITSLDTQTLEAQARASTRQAELCGLGPVLTLMTMAKSFKQPKAVVLNARNSYETTGTNPQKVVGYASVAFLIKKSEEKPGTKKETESKKPSQETQTKIPSKSSSLIQPLSLEEKKELMRIAKLAVETAVRERKVVQVSTNFPRLKEKGAAFVTLKEHGELRGCIGHIIAREPLYLCVRDVAISAALNDPRFPPVRPEELDKLEYEISVLTPMQKVEDPSTIQVGRDGLLMKKGFYQGVLLPQVPVEQGWNREQFLSHTCLKAGMPPDCWHDPEVEIYRFQAIVFSEGDLE